MMENSFPVVKWPIAFNFLNFLIEYHHLSDYEIYLHQTKSAYRSLECICASSATSLSFDFFSLQAQKCVLYHSRYFCKYETNSSKYGIYGCIPPQKSVLDIKIVHAQLAKHTSYACLQTTSSHFDSYISCCLLSAPLHNRNNNTSCVCNQHIYIHCSHCKTASVIYSVVPIHFSFPMLRHVKTRGFSGCANSVELTSY